MTPLLSDKLFFVKYNGVKCLVFLYKRTGLAIDCDFNRQTVYFVLRHRPYCTIWVLNSGVWPTRKVRASLHPRMIPSMSAVSLFEGFKLLSFIIESL